MAGPNFQDLLILQKAMGLAENWRLKTENLPK
jgi:hypothetical protein